MTIPRKKQDPTNQKLILKSNHIFITAAIEKEIGNYSAKSILAYRPHIITIIYKNSGHQKYDPTLHVDMPNEMQPNNKH